jgi:hypothetical protein
MMPRSPQDEPGADEIEDAPHPEAPGSEDDPEYDPDADPDMQRDGRAS